MDKYEKRVMERLHESGAQRLDSRGHRKWRMPDGKIFVQPCTPSDWRNFRKQLSTLKRILDVSDSEPISLQPVNGSLSTGAPPPRVRFAVANNPAREKVNDVLVLRLPPTSPRTSKVDWQFEDLNDVLTAVDHVPEYWELNCGGRVQVIMKLASRFAKKIQVLTAFAVVAPINEVNLDPPSPYITDHSEDAKRKRDWALIGRIRREWGGTAGPGERWCQRMVGLPCLRIEDKSGGETMIETSASGLLLDTEETMAFSGIQFFAGTGLASMPQWSNYEQAVLSQPTALPYPSPDKGYLTYMFFDRQAMRKANITHKNCGNGINPSHVRRVIKRVYEVCSSSDAYRVTNI